MLSPALQEFIIARPESSMGYSTASGRRKRSGQGETEAVSRAVTAPESGMDDDKKKFKCQQCKQLFSTKGNLRRHEQATHRPGGLIFPCPTCGKKFKRKEDRTTHMRVHTGKLTSLTVPGTTIGTLEPIYNRGLNLLKYRSQPFRRRCLGYNEQSTSYSYFQGQEYAAYV